jgi:hypothetical protein
MEQKPVLKYFHYCHDPPAKCQVKKQHLERYRQLLGIRNTRVVERQNDLASIQIKKTQLESLVQLALYKEKRVRTEPTEAEYERLLRTSQIVKRGLASFNQTNQEDIRLFSGKVNSTVRHPRPHATYTDHISRVCIGE